MPVFLGFTAPRSWSEVVSKAQVAWHTASLAAVCALGDQTHGPESKMISRGQAASPAPRAFRQRDRFVARNVWDHPLHPWPVRTKV